MPRRVARRVLANTDAKEQRERVERKYERAHNVGEEEVAKGNLAHWAGNDAALVVSQDVCVS